MEEKKVIGLICEYNPFHNGHIYHIQKIKEMYPNSLLILVLSTSFTMRGEISILNKWDKTKLALENNIDLVIELPHYYATNSADIFAKGASFLGSAVIAGVKFAGGTINLAVGLLAIFFALGFVFLKMADKVPQSEESKPDIQ